MREIDVKDGYSEGFNLAGTPNYKRRYSTKSAKAIVLEGATILRNGSVYTIKSKNVGAGIHEVWAEEKY